MTILLPNC